MPLEHVKKLEKNNLLQSEFLKSFNIFMRGCWFKWGGVLLLCNSSTQTLTHTDTHALIGVSIRHMVWIGSAAGFWARWVPGLHQAVPSSSPCLDGRLWASIDPLHCEAVIGMHSFHACLGKSRTRDPWSLKATFFFPSSVFLFCRLFMSSAPMMSEGFNLFLVYNFIQDFQNKIALHFFSFYLYEVRNVCRNSAEIRFAA